MNTTEANTKFLRGKALSDEELNSLCNFYKGLLDSVGQLGIEFFLFEKELHSRYARLKDFKLARKD
jgi:hypothetical protein